jgi:transcription antitermination factor NusG
MNRMGDSTPPCFTPFSGWKGEEKADDHLALTECPVCHDSSNLRILDGTDRTVQNREFIKSGDRVMIMEGPLKGLMGFYLQHKGQSRKVVVSVELLHRSLEVEIEAWALEKMD